MLFHEYLKKEIFKIVKKLLEERNLDSNFLKNNSFNVELSHKAEFGDLSSNVALVFSKVFKTSPQKLAELISIEFKDNIDILKIEVIKPGFINFFFTDSFWQNQLSKFIKLNDSYNYNLKTKSICIEFVSANPTGLMHIGHARGAVLGDTISSVLEEVGHNVTREYYINDAGEQIKKLNKTILFHLKNILKNKTSKLTDDLYPGEYLKNIASKILNKYSLNSKSDLKKIKKTLRSTSFDSLKKNEMKRGFSEAVFDRVDKEGAYRLNNYIRSGGGDVNLRINKPHFYYPIYVNKETKEISLIKKNDYIEVFPITKNGQERTWKTKKDTLEERLLSKNIVAELDNENNIQIYEKYRPQQVIKTHWILPKYHSIHYGTNLLAKIVGKGKFSYPKSLFAVSDVVRLFTKENDIILDFFAGSSTTAHAVMYEDSLHNENRKFILIEQISNQVKVGIERISKVIKKSIEKVPSGYKNISFIYFELAEYNEEAKNKIDACKSYKELKKLFTELTDYYFLNYNVSVKQFNDQLLDDKDFQELPLEEQKTLFKALLDNNQLYIPYKEQEDGKYNLSKEDQKLTNEFYG